jgi:L-alanine-DL-glutamate epimerase-like enolase superfamily enzyme
MKITGARVVVTCPRRNFVTLKIETDGGLAGLGDATLNGRELAVASYLSDHVVPCLVGRDAHRIEDISQYLSATPPTCRWRVSRTDALELVKELGAPSRGLVTRHTIPG